MCRVKVKKFIGAWIPEADEEDRGEVDPDNAQAVAENEGEDVTDAGKVSLRFQSQRSQSYLAGNDYRKILLDRICSTTLLD